MRWRELVAITGACLFSVSLFAADKVPLSAAEIDKLGIELATPETAQRLSATLHRHREPPSLRSLVK